MNDRMPPYNPVVFRAQRESLLEIEGMPHALFALPKKIPELARDAGAYTYRRWGVEK